MPEEEEMLLHEIHKISREYYSVERSSSGALFYEYLARRLCEIGYMSPEEIERQEQGYIESEKLLNRDAAFEERRLHDEVEYWKGKNYMLGQRSRE